MDLFTYKRALAIAEAEIQSKLNSEEKLNELRVKIAVFKKKIEEIENYSSSLLNINARKSKLNNNWKIINNPIIRKIGSFFKIIWSYMILVIIGLIIAYFTHWFGWNK